MLYKYNYTKHNIINLVLQITHVLNCYLPLLLINKNLTKFIKKIPTNSFKMLKHVKPNLLKKFTKKFYLNMLKKKKYQGEPIFQDRQLPATNKY